MIRRHRIFYAADTGITIPATTAADIPVVKHSVDTTPKPVAVESQPAVEKLASKVISPAAELGLALPKTKGPKEVLGDDADSPEDTMANIDARLKGGIKATRERNPDGTFKPKEAPEEAPGAPKATPVAKAPEAKPQAKPAAAPPAPAAPTKIKIGTEEKTAEEWEAHWKELEAKAKPPETPAEPAKEPEPEPVIDEAKQEADFIEAYVAANPFTAEEIDTVLASGDPAKFAQMMAKVDLNASKRMAAKMNEALEDIYAQLDAQKPIREMYQSIEQHRTEAAFLAAHPDIQAHEKGAEDAREVRQILTSNYDAIQQRISQNTATPKERGYALMFESMTPEEFNENVAAHVRQRLAIGAASTPEPAAATPTPKVPAAKPFQADRPNGKAGSPQPLDRDAQLARELANYQPGS